MISVVWKTEKKYSPWKCINFYKITLQKSKSFQSSCIFEVNKLGDLVGKTCVCWWPWPLSSTCYSVPKYTCLLLSVPYGYPNVSNIESYLKTSSIPSAVCFASDCACEKYALMTQFSYFRKSNLKFHDSTSVMSRQCSFFICIKDINLWSLRQILFE